MVDIVQDGVVLFDDLMIHLMEDNFIQENKLLVIFKQDEPYLVITLETILSKLAYDFQSDEK